MQAIDTSASPGLSVVDGDDATAIDAPRHLILIFASGEHALQSMHRSASQRNFIRALSRLHAALI